MTVLGGALCQITSIPSVLEVDVLKSFACSSHPRTRHVPKSLLALFPESTPILSYFIPHLPFRSLFLFCCLVLDISTIFAPAPLPLVLAEAAAAAVFARTPLPLVLAEAAASAVFARAPLPLVLADAAAAAVFAPALHPLVLAEAAASAVFA